MAVRVRMKGCCDCSDGCTLQCRSQTGSATLCGFPELGAPSSPPRRYRKRSLTGTITRCDFQAPECSQPSCPVSLPSSYEVTGTGAWDINGFWRPYAWEAKLTKVSFNRATQKWTYQVDRSRFLDPTLEDPAWVTAGLAVGGTVLGVGQRAEFSTCTELIPVITYFGWSIYDSARTIMTPAGETSSGGKRDVWHDVRDYAPGLPGACVAAGDGVEGHSFDLPPGGCWEGSTGTEVMGPFNLPPEEAYGAAIRRATDTPTQIIWTGVGCTETPIGSKSTTGELALVLSDEDTPDDAIDRATAGHDYAGESTCSGVIAYIFPWSEENPGFEFKAVQVRALCGSIERPLVVNHSYRAKINIARRQLGTEDAFISAGFIEITMTATEPVGWTDWVDVPNTVGWETMVTGCKLEEVS